MSIFSAGQIASRFSSGSAFSTDEGIPSSDASFTSGVGTLLEEEHELLALISKGIDHAYGVNIDGIERILSHHARETEEIIALLELYSESLPIPHRFGVLKSGPSLHLHTAATPAVPGLSLLDLLVAQHRRLFANLETLRKSSRGNCIEPNLLSVAAQRHEDMAWMLTALEKEDERPSDPQLTPVVASELRVAEQNWATDGGHENRATTDQVFGDHISSR